MTTSKGQTLRLSLTCEPTPTPRPQIATRGKFAHAYYPAKYVAWKDSLRDQIKDAVEARGFVPTDPSAPVTLAVEFVSTPPKTTKLEFPKPDLDNYLKGLMDAITQSGRVWTDDSQVNQFGRMRKRWATPGEPPAIHVTITFEV